VLLLLLLLLLLLRGPLRALPPGIHAPSQAAHQFKAPGAHSNSDAAPDVVNRLGYYVGVATQSDNAAPDITPPPGDREFARLYGVRITEITQKMKG
jgi:hypothetical protein